MLEWLMGKSFNPEKDIPSLSGKVILVTGGMRYAAVGRRIVLIYMCLQETPASVRRPYYN